MRNSIHRYLTQHPRAGVQEPDGTYVYRKKGLHIRYAYQPASVAPGHMTWISAKRRLPLIERMHNRLTRKIRALVSRGAEPYLRWQTGGLLLLLLLLSVGLTESSADKAQRMQWVIATSLGIDAKRVEVRPGGWVEFSGKRRTAVDAQDEPVQYMFNPLRWMLGKQHGYVIRYRGEPYGYVAHAISFSDKADVWIHKDGGWQHGKLTGRHLQWSTPEGTGIRAGRVYGQDVHTVSDQSIK